MVIRITRDQAMNLQFASDIHREFKHNPPVPDIGADVLVLAGDIGYDPRMLVEVGHPNRRARHPRSALVSRYLSRDGGGQGPGAEVARRVPSPKSATVPGGGGRRARRRGRERQHHCHCDPNVGGAVAGIRGFQGLRAGVGRAGPESAWSGAAGYARIVAPAPGRPAPGSGKIRS